MRPILIFRAVGKVFKWITTTIAIIVLIWIVYSFIVSLGYVSLDLQEDSSKSDYLEYRGAVHIHTTYSDGAWTPEEILDVARDENLDFIIITDHNSMGAAPLEKKFGDKSPILITGNEISTEAGHLLAYFMDEPADRFPANTQEAIDEVNRKGGIAVPAHPNRKKTPWTDWSVYGWKGMEIINLSSMPYVHNRAAIVFMFPRGFFNLRGSLAKIIRYPRENIGIWDNENLKRKVIGFAGCDAHGPKVLGFPPYDSMMTAINLHVIPDRGDSAKPKRSIIIEAMRRGRFYMSIDCMALSEEFDFKVIDPEGNSSYMGDVVEYKNGYWLILSCRAPSGARVRILHNGKILKVYNTLNIQMLVNEPGIYRAEVWIPEASNPYGDDKIWLISNPVYIIENEKLAQYRD